ncbi:uncharacterized protein LAESUDRAFT_60420 [Laetiporus sulphureus 93-53]|uniref:Uncharacterized protein n=1 Tax=Laetiporus sulphureus 93-53 TaxID=1314785 RepID=A0A165AXA9_9APHY|nr:uncharacterized protein LAESUDRAFT_60420 [Laetiporus sulphureus 93-53]KZS99832.1 hypothetical protein LAESUDRAFT_60420 [Laetiporus sulphureus 93-53]
MSGVVAIQPSNMDSNSIDSFLLQLVKRTTKMVDQNAGDASNDTLDIIDGLLRTTAANVRATLNARLPINRLPPEILTLIFKMLRDPALLTSANSWHYENRTHAIWDHEATNPQNLVTATHACRHWRNVALANASLWDTLCCNRLGAAVGEFLERSGSVPLCVVEDDRDLGDAFLSTVPLLSARLRELHFLDLPGYRYQEPLYGLMSELQFPTPHLRMLTLGVRRSSGPRGHGAILFNGVTPCLERLSLFGLRWLPTNQFPNLTHLYLYNYCPVPIKLSSLLSRTLQLIDLVVSEENGRDRKAALDDYPHTPLLSFTTTGPPDEILKVSLPLLQRIVFRHASGILAHVLPGLIISDDAAIRIEDLTIRDSSDFLIIRNLLQP